MRALVKILNLNQMCYRKTFDIQMKIVKNIKNSIECNCKETQNTLILVEHKPVYTIGIRTQTYEDSHFQNKLKGLGADFVRTNRGGLITFHGLGQLVVYPILYLPDFEANKSIRCYVRRLESTAIDLCKLFAVKASVIEGLPGVWVNEERKIAAIGVHCSNFVTSHGIAINCNVDLKWFEHIVACGLPHKTVTSLSNELKADITIADVLPHFLHCFQNNFNCDFIDY